MEILIPHTLNGTSTGIPPATPPPGWRITRPLEKLLVKYLTPAWASRDFDLYIAQRQAVPGWSNRIEGADLYATLLMAARIQNVAVSGLRIAGASISAPLTRLPNRDLGGMSTQEFRNVSADLQQVFDACRVPYVQLAIASKLLCQKRPYLIPMLDGKVQSALGRPPGLRRLPTHGARAIAYVDRFRLLMGAASIGGWSNLGALTCLAATLTDVVSKHLWGLGVAPPHPDFSPARILDKLIWFDWQGYQYYGWVPNPAAGQTQPPPPGGGGDGGGTSPPPDNGSSPGTDDEGSEAE